jgi:hypothetical protein
MALGYCARWVALSLPAREDTEGAKAEHTRNVTHVERVYNAGGQTRRTTAPEIGSPRVSCGECKDVKDPRDGGVSDAAAPAAEDEKTNPTGVSYFRISGMRQSWDLKKPKPPAANQFEKANPNLLPRFERANPGVREWVERANPKLGRVALKKRTHLE